MHKVKRISQIHAYGSDYPIKWMDTLYRENDRLAEVNHDTSEIHIDLGCRGNKTRIFKILVHEITHIVEQNVADILEEETLHRIAMGIAVILLDSGIVNPEEFDFG